MDLNKCQIYIRNLNKESYYSKSYIYQEKEYLPDAIKIIENLKLDKNSKVLDIGPGWGTLPLWYSYRFNDITTMDIVPLNHWIKEDFIKEYGIKYIQDSVFNNIEGEYDLISMTQVIPHLKWNPLLAIKNIHDALNDNGYFICCVINNDIYLNIKSTYGTQWEKLPDYDTNIAACEDIVTAMYGEKELKEILGIFREVKITKNHCELYAQCRK